MISVIEITSDESIPHIRTLFREYQAAFLTEEAFQRYLALQNFEAELARLPNGYLPPQGTLLLATFGEAPAGCVALRQLEETICEMKRLYVRPEYRGFKLGRILVEAVITKR